MEYKEIEEVEEINFPWLIFRIGDGFYTVSSKFITSIVTEPDEITFVPKVSDYIVGLIQLRGNVVPLISLKLLLNIKDEEAKTKENKMVIVLEENNSFVGLVVDEVISVENVTHFEETEEIRKVYKDGFIKGIAKDHNNKEVLLVLDEEKIMDAA